MNNLQIFKDEQLIPVSENETGEVTVNARNVHGFLKVQQDFSDWIKKQLEMIGAEKEKEYSLLKGETSILGGRPLTEYILTLDIAKEICMVAGVAPRTNEETKKLSKVARQYFIKVEKAWNSPEMIMKRALEFASKRIEDLKLENTEKEKRLTIQQPKVVFADAVSASHTSILVGDLAKLLKQNGIDTGANRLFERLRKEGYLIKRKGTDYNMPTQSSMELKLFEIKETSIVHGDGHISISKTPKITGKGQIYFINRFK
ncbi:phage antirepressor KilAC domain-containing protein [Clostridium estertheticum]|uniref:phage antirepressor KilAC domain-containing protein n=1 Tax=Clostridium estertheticum TaxID=238834 RepID=UPI0013EEC6ED|nr:phage antirepressor KilAC domain-containing protein [Clostridium estertheticum]MBZ9608673.1 phage antirepressor KilAC domain-containing protein [Clostridium estertheticum]